MLRPLIRRGVIAGATLVVAEAAYAVLRPAPDLEEFDPSSEFGDPSHPELRVVVLGDSSVTAPGVSGPEDIWVTVICEKLAVDRHVILESVAIGGSMAHDLLDDQVDRALNLDPHLIFVSVGANDVIKGVPRRVFARNLDEVIERLSASGAVIVQSGVGVLGTIPRLHPPLSNLVSRRSERFDAVHWQVAEKYGTHVVHQRSDDPELWNRDRSLWAADDFHVSAAGHKRWADIAWQTVAPLVTNRSQGPSQEEAAVTPSSNAR